MAGCNYPPGGLNVPYDKIIISTSRPEHRAAIKKQLDEMSVPREKVDVLFESEDMITTRRKIEKIFENLEQESDPRIMFIRDFSRYVKEEKMPGNVAECGVNTGETAFYINKFFKDRKCYLFDSFEGFSKEDVEAEVRLGNDDFNNGTFNHVGLFSGTSAEAVISAMPYPNNCIIKKGYVPATFEKVDDTFCFVNLDMDLYTPMLSALEFFYPKMIPGGLLLLHDYWLASLPGVKKAVRDFEAKNGRIYKTPIGDGCSIAIIKQIL